VVNAAAQSVVTLGEVMLRVVARFVTRVPANDLGEGAVRFLRGLGMDTSVVNVEPVRLGVYYQGPGADADVAK
jgi:sugar/nucleoside kinase (ribokinase family)